MAQYTVNLHPNYGTQATIRLVRRSSRESVTFVVRNGETIVSDDPELIVALQSLVDSGQRVLDTRVSRPASPTHNADTKPRVPAPVAATEGR